MYWGQGYEIYLWKFKICFLKINMKFLKDIYDIDDLMVYYYDYDRVNCMLR